MFATLCIYCFIAFSKFCAEHAVYFSQFLYVCSGSSVVKAAQMAFIPAVVTLAYTAGKKLPEVKDWMQSTLAEIK